MTVWLVAWTSPDGEGGYSAIRTERFADAMRQFRLWLGYGFHVDYVMKQQAAA